jgi:hypothetical protein
LPAVSALSNEVIWVPVRSDHPISGAAVLTSYTVEIAVTTGDPGALDWKAATWEASTKTIGGVAYYLARIEIGPNGGALTLTDGVTYQVHARVTTAGEKPVVYAGALQAY